MKRAFWIVAIFLTACQPMAQGVATASQADLEDAMGRMKTDTASCPHSKGRSNLQVAECMNGYIEKNYGPVFEDRDALLHMENKLIELAIKRDHGIISTSEGAALSENYFKEALSEENSYRIAANRVLAQQQQARNQAVSQAMQNSAAELRRQQQEVNDANNRHITCVSNLGVTNCY